ncbi:MAG: TolC family protein [Gloeomargarita sp. DG02_4_bins_56]
MNWSPIRWCLCGLLAVTVAYGGSPAGIAETGETELPTANPGQVPGLPHLPPVTPVPPNSPGVQDFQNLPPLLAPVLPEENPLATPTTPAEVEIKTDQALSLPQALALAAQTNRNLQAARAQIDAARAGLRQAQAALFPTLDFQSNFQRTESAQSEISARLAPPGAAVNEGASLTWDGVLRLNYNIYTGGQRGARIQQAQEQLRQAILNAVQVAQELQLNVSNAYYDLQDADAQVTIGQSAVRNAEVSLRDAQAQLRAGVGTQFAVLQAQVQLANAQQQLVNAQRNRAVAQRNLVQILSLGNQVTVTAADPIETAGQWTIPLEESIILGWQQRPELMVQLSQRRFQQAQRELALAGIRPNLSLFARTDYLRFYESPTGLDKGGFGQGYVFGLQLSFTLFDGGAAFAGARQAEANIAVADINYANARNQVRFQVEQALSDLRANETNIKTAALALEQANESLRLARLRFQAGVGTQTDVINQENALTQAQGNLVNAVLGYNRALAALQRAVGNPPFHFGRQPAPPSP